TPFTLTAAYASTDQPTGPLIPNTGMDLVPAHYTFTNNLFEKPQKYNRSDPNGAWRKPGEAYSGTFWFSKNQFELKSGQFFTIKNNIFQNTWYGVDQYGFGVLFTPRGRSPWYAPGGWNDFQGGPWTGVNNI